MAGGARRQERVGVGAGAFDVGTGRFEGAVPVGEGVAVVGPGRPCGWRVAPGALRLWGGTPFSGGRDGDGRASGASVGPGTGTPGAGRDGEAGGAIGCGFAGVPPPGHRNTAIVTRTAAVTAAASAGNAHRHRLRSGRGAVRPASWNLRTVPGPTVIWSAAAR
ncbi:hypothetical protein GCM10009727_66120 [Actinomadura napierensis]|uniref:Uncharacterized protein n=1 Tax=Actinomadura napierensis TaxID=267854 RepID=A0ABP5M447_9ACTN